MFGYLSLPVLPTWYPYLFLLHIISVFITYSEKNSLGFYKMLHVMQM